MLGARGAFEKSNAPAKLLARASRRASGSSSQLSSMNRRIEVVSSRVLSTWPRRAYGLTSSAGTRNPSVPPATLGGRTWSNHPPQSS